MFKVKAILLILLTFIAGCATVGMESAFLPTEQEVRLGQSLKDEVFKKYPLYPNKEAQAYLQSVGQRIARNKTRPIPYEFYLVKSDEVNAFALPGGPVFVTTGLFKRLSSESELAAVLGHEISHVELRHHAKFLEKVYGLNFLLNLAYVLSGGGARGEVVAQLGSISANLLALKFSRDQESEADQNGIKLMLQAGYDPYGMIRVFEMFKKMEKQRPPEWLSTHPLPESRIVEAKRTVEMLRPSGALITDTEEFHRIKRLVN